MDKLNLSKQEAIDVLKSNKPTSGYIMLCEAIDIAVGALEREIAQECKDDKSV